MYNAPIRFRVLKPGIDVMLNDVFVKNVAKQTEVH